MHASRHVKKRFELLIARLYVAGMVVLCVGGLTVSCTQKRPQKPNILLITLDTTRWDHLSCNGYSRESTPNIDALAKEGVRYENAISASSWTLPAHASIFTGMLPTYHSAHFAYGPDVEINKSLGFSFYTLHTMLPTLAEELAKDGYDTTGIIAGPALNSTFGIARGFEQYDDRLPKAAYWERRADEVTSLAVRRLKEHAYDSNAKPMFLFLNYFDPHNPYYAPEPWRGPHVPEDICDIHNAVYDDVFRGTRDLTDKERTFLTKQYDAEIGFMDSEIGRLFSEMKQLGMYDSTLIVVTADHGESLGEHRLLEHGRGLYQDLIHVPLIVKYPLRDERRGVVSRQVTTMSIMPTLLKYIGCQVPKTVSCGTLDEDNQTLVAEIYRDVVWMKRYGERFDVDQKAAYEGDYKLIWRSDGAHELYNLSTDPGEEKNLYGTMPEVEQRFMSRLRPLIEESGKLLTLTAPALDQELKNRLRALGYVQ